MTITLAQLNAAAAEIAKLPPHGQVLVQLRDGTRIPFVGQGGRWVTLHTDVVVEPQPQTDNQRKGAVT